MRRVKESEINKALRVIERMISDGWSIQVATARACGSCTNSLSYAVKKTKSYLNILNFYMATLPNSHEYERRDGKILPKKGAYGVKNRK